MVTEVSFTCTEKCDSGSTINGEAIGVINGDLEKNIPDKEIKIKNGMDKEIAKTNP